MKQLLFIFLLPLLFPVLLSAQSEGGFGFRRFANKAALDATTVTNSDKSASRRAYVNSTGLYYVWDGSTWIAEIAIDTLSFSNDTLRLSLLRDGVPAKVVRILESDGFIIDTVANYDSLRIYNRNAPLVYVKQEGIRGVFQRVDWGLAIDDGGINISGDHEWVRFAEDTSVVNVRWFGAIGDSLTDDNTAIQNTLAYCLQHPKSTLYFPSGKYRYSSEIYAYKPVDINIQGDGMNQTYLLPTNVNGIHFRTDSTTTVVDGKYGFAEMRDFQISNLSILRVGTNAYSTKVVGLYLRGGFNTKLENVRVEEFFATSGGGIGGIGIKLDNTIPGDVDAVQHTTFDNVWVAECDTGIVTRLHNTMIWHDVKVDQCRKFGVVLRNGVYWNKGMVQGSENCGIMFDHRATPYVISDVHLQDVYFESNAYVAPKYGTLYKPDNVNANSIHVNNCGFSAGTGAKLFNLRRIINSSFTNNKYTGSTADTISLTSLYNVRFGGDNYYTLALTTSDCYINWLNGNGSGTNQKWLGQTIGKGSPGNYALTVGGTGIIDDSLAVGIDAPTATLDVDGTSRLRSTTGTPTVVMGRDNDGYVGAVGIGTGLDLTGGTLSNTVINTNIYNSDDSFTATRLASLDTTKTLAIGRWASPPDAGEITSNYYRHGLVIGANTGSGRRAAIAGSAYDRLSGSYVTADRASVQFNASQLIGTQTVSNSSVYGTNSTYNYISDPRQSFQNTEYGQRNIARGTPKSIASYLYMYQGGDMITSSSFDTCAISAWLGYPQLTDTTASAKSVFGTKAVSKTRGWGVQSLFHTVSSINVEHPFNWIKIETGSVAADTSTNGILLYDKYRLPNAIPSNTLGDSSVIAWVGTGTNTSPVFVPFSTSSGGGTNIYNSNGTTTNNTRELTIRPGGTLTFAATDSTRGKFPFRVVATGNEPDLQLWKGNVDSTWIRQSDIDYEIGCSATLNVYSQDVLYMQADSIILQGVASTTKIHNLLGLTNGGVVKQIQGASDGDVLSWNAAGGYWESTPAAGGGNGIYGGSNVIPDNTVATATANGDFQIAYDGGNPGFEIDDALGQTYISGKDGTYSAYADNSNAGLVAGTATWLVGSDYALTATADVANTNTVANRLVIKTNSTGTPAASFGSRFLVQGESTTTVDRDMFAMDFKWSTATDATRTGKLDFYTVNSGGALTNTFRFAPGAFTIYTTLGTFGCVYANNGITTAQSFTLGGSPQALTLGNSSGTVNITTSSTNPSAISISSTASGSSNTSGINIGGGTSFTQTSGTRNYVNHTASFAPTSGTAEHNSFVFSGTFNQTGGANGITRGIYLNQTLTAVADFRAIDIAANGSNAKGIYQTGSSLTNNFVGKTRIGDTTTPDDALEVTGNLELTTAGNKIKIATGSNASVGTATLVAGTVTVNTTAVTTSSIIFISYNTLAGTPGSIEAPTASIVNGTSFVINSSSVVDTSTVNWWIVN